MSYAFKPDSQQAYELAQRLLFANGWKWTYPPVTGVMTATLHRIPGVVLYLCEETKTLLWSYELDDAIEINADQLIKYAIEGTRLPAQSQCQIGDHTAVLTVDEDGNPALKIHQQIVTRQQIVDACQLLGCKKDISGIFPKDTWLAMDANREWFLYLGKPRNEDHHWIPTAGEKKRAWHIGFLKDLLPERVNWKDSLIQIG